MKAVILAGGVRSGLEIPGSNLPRALWPFPSEPLIHEVIAFLRRSGVDAIAVCANGKTRMIASELSKGARPWMDIHYSEDAFPRGPAGCLRDLREWLGSDDFLAIQGTAFYDFDLAALVAAHRDSGAAITIGAADNAGTLSPAGVYMIRPDTLDLVNPVGYQDMKEQFLPRAIQAGHAVRAHTLAGEALLIHGVENYIDAIGAALPRMAGQSGYQELSPGVWAHESAHISPAARIAGPVWIDRHARIDADAVIVGPAVIGPNASIARGALVHRAVLFAYTHVERLATRGVYTPKSTAPAARDRQVRATRPSRLFQAMGRLVAGGI